MSNIKIGDRLVVGQMREFPAFVEAVDYSNDIGTIIYLDWGIHGKSKVFAHDEGKTWHKYLELN